MRSVAFNLSILRLLWQVTIFSRTGELVSVIDIDVRELRVTRFSDLSDRSDLSDNCAGTGRMTQED